MSAVRPSSALPRNETAPVPRQPAPFAPPFGSSLGLTSQAGLVLVAGAAFVALCLAKLYSYNLFHSLVEIFGVGIAYLFVGGIGLAHTLAYRGDGRLRRLRRQPAHPTDVKSVPDFLDYVYLDGLEAVRPGTVNIIRRNGQSPEFVLGGGKGLKRVAAAVAVIVVTLLVGSAAWYLLYSPTTGSVMPQPIAIGVPPNEQSALVFIAEDQQLFAQNGLNATVVMYDSALAALDGLANHEVAIAQSAEYPIVGRALQKASITVIASVDRHHTVHLVGRRDRGIANVADLKGKRIGVPRGTITEYYLGKVLTRHGLSLQDVTLVNMQFAQSAEALSNGSVDAFQLRNRDIGPIEQRLGGNLVIWPSQSDQAAYEVLSGRSDWVASQPDTIRKLLRTLAQAEEYAASHPAEAMASVQRRLKYDDEYMAAIGPQHQYSLSLDQSLILAMEGEARWMISSNLTSEKLVPNFLDHIYLDGLKAVRPGAVNVIR